MPNDDRKESKESAMEESSSRNSGLSDSVIEADDSDDVQCCNGKSEDSRKFEPLRRIKSSSPPKRFYRTFWRGLVSRAIAAHSDKINGRSNGSLSST
jgi:hypothetical protein